MIGFVEKFYLYGERRSPSFLLSITFPMENGMVQFFWMRRLKSGKFTKMTTTGNGKFDLSLRLIELQTTSLIYHTYCITVYTYISTLDFDQIFLSVIYMYRHIRSITAYQYAN